jgi:hypothetical protein
MSEDGWNLDIKSGAEMQAETHAEQQAERAAAREAAYAYRDAGAAYGTNRSLHVPGGYNTARHVYTGSNPQNHRRFSHGRRQSQNRGYRYTGGYPSANAGHGKTGGQGAWAGFWEWWRGLLGMTS